MYDRTGYAANCPSIAGLVGRGPPPVRQGYPLCVALASLLVRSRGVSRTGPVALLGNPSRRIGAICTELGSFCQVIDNRGGAAYAAPPLRTTRLLRALRTAS